MTAPIRHVIWVFAIDFATGLDLGMALNSIQAFIPTTAPHPITGDIAGVVSGTTPDGDFWVSVADSRDARKAACDITGKLPRDIVRLDSGD